MSVVILPGLKSSLCRGLTIPSLLFPFRQRVMTALLVSGPGEKWRLPRLHFAYNVDGKLYAFTS